MAEPPIGVPGGRDRRRAARPVDACRAPATGDPAAAAGGVAAAAAARAIRAPPARWRRSLPPSNVPKDYYDLAYGYVLRKDYALAEDAFQTFLKKYPSDRCVPDAQFWLGESLFQRQRYDAAAERSSTLSTKYGSARQGAGRAAAARPIARGAEAKGDGLRDLRRSRTANIPRASNTVKQGVEREQKRVRC